QDPQPEALLTFLRKMEFTTLTKRISEKLGVEAPAAAPPAPSPAGAKAEVEPVPTSRRGAPSQTGGNDTGGTSGPGSPAAGAAIHSVSIAKVPFDRAAYETVASLDRLAWWTAAVREAGRFALDIETTALDCMNCDLVGFSLAVAPGKACYVPVGHRPAEGGFDFGDGTGLPQA